METKIKTAPGLDQLFKQLGNDLEAGRSAAMTDVVETIEAHTVKIEAPHAKASNLVNGISSYILDRGNKGVVRASAKNKAGYDYAQAVFDGSKPHIIKPKNGRALFWPGAKHPVRSVKHPGFAGRHGFERAIEKDDPARVYDEGLMNFLRRRGW